MLPMNRDSYFGRPLREARLIPFFGRFGVVVCEIRIVIGPDPDEITERVQIGAALQVALAVQQNKAEPGPAWLAAVYAFHGVQEPDQFGQRKRPGRSLLR